jgi:aminoglycoside N3'-acetyltransferase
LADHSSTRDIIFRHLKPLGIDEQQIVQVHATLKELANTNMGGGIPYDTMMPLVAALDELSVAKIKQP